MTTLIAEQPLLLSLMLGVLATGLIYGWLQTGKRGFGIGGLGVFVLIPVAWLVSEYWVTDREQLRELIFETADAVESNDIERAVLVIGKRHPQLVARAKAELANYEFRQASVNQIRRINVDANALPTRAEVELIAGVDVTSRRGQFSAKTPRRLTLQFEKQSDGQWAVVEYSQGPVIGDRDAFSSSGP
jgi:ketosteroid isomerase-like protein